VKAQHLTAKEREKYFISLYVKEGAVEEKIAYAERRASLEPGTGHRILQRKKVQEEIMARMEPVRLEQMRQQLLGDAAAVAHEALQNDLTKKVAGICRQKIDVEVLDHELMRMVVGLDQDKHPKAKLAAIIAAYVVNGTLESNSTRRLSPPDNEASAGIYTSLFDRLRSSAPQEKVYPLFPEEPPQKDTGIAPGLLPAPGESIDDPPTPPNNHPGVITVDVDELATASKTSSCESEPGDSGTPGESIDDPPTQPNNHSRVITVEIG
jgi:hypothetical protein